MVTTQTEFIQWISNLLRDRDLKPSQLAKRMGVSHPTVGRWITGEDVPSTKSCRKLAEFTGTPIERILALSGHLQIRGKDDPASLPEFREYMRLKYPGTNPGFLDAIARSIDRK